MHGIARRRLLAVIVPLTLAVVVLLVGRLLAAKGVAWATDVSGIVSGAFIVAAPAVVLLKKTTPGLSGAAPLSTITLQEARAGYADALAKQWTREDQQRQIYDPWPLPVSWRLADAKTEQFAGIRETFTHTPARRMVILGAAGAGKSVLAIKLVRDLLESREPADRVPVLLPAATWTRDCTMTEWITGQLVASQPSLDVRIRTGTGEKVWLPQALVDSGVIPVIDGLDELPPDRWTTVISEINACGSDYPLVLTSRPAEYYAAISARGISQAVMIELEPLQVREVKRYLSEATDSPAGRWSRVFGVLDAEPDSVLTRTLTAADMESIEFHPVRGGSYTRTAICVRLRPTAAVRLQSADGWFPLYWTSALSTGIPPELLVALGVNASARLAGPLKRRVARLMRLPAPVRRDPRPRPGRTLGGYSWFSACQAVCAASCSAAFFDRPVPAPSVFPPTLTQAVKDFW
jgi:hypothetical protein